LVNAYSGLTFDQQSGEIGFKPAREGDGIHFWSAGRGWGTVQLSKSQMTLIVKGGELVVSRLRLPWLRGVAKVDGQVTGRDGDLILLGRDYALRSGDQLIVGVDAHG
jgi:hypothetical protein